KMHRRRQRKPQLGMLVLIDGSQHDWLEGRGPRLCLHAAIDDAQLVLLIQTQVYGPGKGLCGIKKSCMTSYFKERKAGG
ncbi:MAG: hypothetical protein ACOZCF_01185, partial [Bacillota bacterium]